MTPQKKPGLLVHVPGQEPHSVPLERDSYALGRSPENDIILPYKDISRRHGLLERWGDSWQYTDLDSTNGTYVQDQRIWRVILRDGMQLRLGKNPRRSVQVVYQADLQVQSEEWLGQPTLPLEPGTTSTQLEAQASSLVEIEQFRAEGDQPVTIGRDPASDILLKSPLISRQHALLQKSREDWILIDLNSHNGTAVNGQRLTAPRLIKKNDFIQLGKFRLVFAGEGLFRVFAASRGIRLDCQGLTWDTGRGARRVRILDDISLSCKPQEFIGVVGGSGAGKTTLLKALAGMLPMHGRVMVEGDDLYQHFDAWRLQIGYVPQENILHRQLTVWQALWYSAKLRLPPDIGKEEINQRIDRVLEQVELTAQRDQVIQSLSGGQRKRASIAVELLADPPLLFLDEPTTGLDPGLEKKLMITLRRLADDGKTIIMVTHATANITECDQVAFLAEGRLVYFGPPRQAGEFFQVGGENFADIYAELGDPDPLSARSKALQWEKRFHASPHFKEYVSGRFETLPWERQAAEIHRHTAARQTGFGMLRQFFYLIRRYLDLILHDRVLLTTLFAIMPVLALLVVLIAGTNWLTGDPTSVIQQQLQEKIQSGAQSASYSVVRNSQALLLIMTLASVLLGLFASAYEIIRERTIYERERMVFLRLLPYLASKLVLLAAFAAVQCLLFLLVISLKVRFPAQGVFFPAFLEIYLTLFFGCLAAILLGLLLSSLASNMNSVVYLILGVLFVQILFAGVMFELPGVANNLSWVTVTRWTTQALGVSANLDELNSLSTTRFVPDAVTREVSVEVEMPDPNWTPVTITTEKVPLPGCIQPVEMPVVQENELVTTQETVTETVTVTPDPVDIHTKFTFALDYTRNPGHLLLDWGMLAALSLVSAAITTLVLKKRDIA